MVDEIVTSINSIKFNLFKCFGSQCITGYHCTGIFQKSAKRHHYIAQQSSAIPPASNILSLRI